MSVIIRLQNLPWSANAQDIRDFFHGLSIPEGGVHIVGGEMGDAFIAFSSDEDARLAMRKSGTALKQIQVQLLLSSRTEMQKVIETARQQALGIQQTITPSPISSLPATPPVQKPMVISPPPEIPSVSVYVEPGATAPPVVGMGPQSQTFGHFLTNPVPKPKVPANPFPPGIVASSNEPPHPFYNQPPIQDAVLPAASSLVPKKTDPRDSPIHVRSRSYQKDSLRDPRDLQRDPRELQRDSKDHRDKSRDDRRRRSKSRSRSRDRDRRRRHRSRSRDRSARRRRSRSRDRDRIDRKDRDKDRDRRVPRDRSERGSSDVMPLNIPHKVHKPSGVGGIPGLGEIPADIPKDGLSILASTGGPRHNEGPIVSTGEWSQKTNVKNSSPDIEEVTMEDISQDGFPQIVSNVGGYTPSPQHRPPGSFTTDSFKSFKNPSPPRIRADVDRIPPSDMNRFPPHNMNRGPPADMSRGPLPDMNRGPPADIIRGPPSNISRGPPSNISRGPPADISRGPPANITRVPPADISRGPPANITRVPPADISRLPPQNMNRGAPPPNMNRGPPPSMNVGPLPNMNRGPPPMNMNVGPPPSMSVPQQGYNDSNTMSTWPQNNNSDPRRSNEHDKPPLWNDSVHGGHQQRDSWGQPPSRRNEAEEGKWVQSRSNDITPNRDHRVGYHDSRPPFEEKREPPVEDRRGGSMEVDKRGSREKSDHYRSGEDRRGSRMDERSNGREPRSGHREENYGSQRESFPPRGDNYERDTGAPSRGRDRHSNNRDNYSNGEQGPPRREPYAPPSRENVDEFPQEEFSHGPAEHFPSPGGRGYFRGESNGRFPRGGFRGRGGRGGFGGGSEGEMIEGGGPPFRGRGRGRGGNFERGGLAGIPHHRGFQSTCVEILNLPPDTKYKPVRDLFYNEGFVVPKDSIKLLADPEGHLLGVALIRFNSTRDAFVVTKLAGSYMGDNRVEVNLIQESVYDQHHDVHDRTPFPPVEHKGVIVDEDKRPPSCVIRVKGLPISFTEDDVRSVFGHYKVEYIHIEYDKGTFNPSGKCFVRLKFPLNAENAVSEMNGTKLDGSVIDVTICPPVHMELAIREREKILHEDHKSNDAPPPTRPQRNVEVDLFPPSRPQRNVEVDNFPPSRPQRNVEVDLLTDCIVIKNSSPDVTERSIQDFFSEDGLKPEKIYFNRPDSQGRSDVFVVFPEVEDTKKAVEKTNQMLGSQKVSIALISKPSVMKAMGLPFDPLELFKKGGGKIPAEKAQQYTKVQTTEPPSDFGKPGCVIALGNVPYTASTDAILEFFKNFNLGPENVLRRYDALNRPTSDARVAFPTARAANDAINRLHQTFIMGRKIFLTPV